MNDQSVGDEPDSAGCSDDPVWERRSLKIALDVAMADKTIEGRIQWLGMEWLEVYAR